MTKFQIKKAMHKNKYIVLRHITGRQKGINCAIINLKSVKRQFEENAETRFISFRKCSFERYISTKAPFY